MKVHHAAIAGLAVLCVAKCFAPTRWFQETEESKWVDIGRDLLSRPDSEPFCYIAYYAKVTGSEDTAEFRVLTFTLNKAYAEENYPRCLEIANKMALIWPKKGFAEALPSFIANMKVEAGDYSGAKQDYDALLADLIPKPNHGSSKHIAASIGRYHLNFLLGNAKQGIKDRQMSDYLMPRPLCYFAIDHYGNAWRELLENAIVKEGDSAMFELAAGERHPFGTGGTVRPSTEAGLILAEQYLRNGKARLAKLAFAAISAEGNSGTARTARQRLKTLSNGQSWAPYSPHERAMSLRSEREHRLY